jgi:energy-coupling factor transporter ATP-binding protein EcfA2
MTLALDSPKNRHKLGVIRHGGDVDHDKPFCIFAIRVNSDNSKGQRKLHANVPYYLMQGFSIEGDYIYVEKKTLNGIEDSIFNQTYTQQSTKAHINISAIVGMNGSGKSTLVEYMMRLLNNLSASVLGEIKLDAATERLHFIPNVDGALFYMKYGYPYVLYISGEHVQIKKYNYERAHTSSGKLAFKLDSRYFYDNQRLENDLHHQILFRDNGPKDILKYIFYTIVSNYSIYAYNTNDYIDEADSDEVETVAEALYEDSISHTRHNPADILDKRFSIDKRCWLHGLFHKNDGYQVPLVLTPFRKEGNININSENILAKERLVSLIVNPKESFRKINEHLEVCSLTLSRNSRSYDYEYVKSMLNSRTLEQEDYNTIRKNIYNCWCERIGMPLGFGSNKKYYSDTINYICYKTLKIAKTYREYNYFYNSLRRNRWKGTSDIINVFIDKLLVDNSHITSRLFQAIDYIAYDIYKDDPTSSPVIPSELKLSQSNKTDDGNRLLFRNLYKCQSVKHIPSPIFNAEINLRDVYNGHEVRFETLSSGEKQLIYAVSSILYHLSNIDSVKDDGNGVRVVYDHVNVILEEIELYFHPDLQKHFVKYLIDGIGMLSFTSLKAINIILVTHSPFVLSDIPSSNILALDKNGNVLSGMKSFASNIHEMLKDSFFMTSSIGDFAKAHIANILSLLQGNNHNVESKDKLHRSIMLIDEPVTRNLLLNEFHKLYPDDNTLRKAELLKELKELGD